MSITFLISCQNSLLFYRLCTDFCLTGLSGESFNSLVRHTKLSTTSVFIYFSKSWSFLVKLLVRAFLQNRSIYMCAFECVCFWIFEKLFLSQVVLTMSSLQLLLFSKFWFEVFTIIMTRKWEKNGCV